MIGSILSSYTFSFVQANPLEDLEDNIELEARQSKSGRKSKSCSGSPTAYVKSKTVTAFMRTELHYKERSFHRSHQTRRHGLFNIWIFLYGHHIYFNVWDYVILVNKIMNFFFTQNSDFEPRMAAPFANERKKLESSPAELFSF